MWALYLFFAILYAQIGFHIARKSWDLWLVADNGTRWGALLYPRSFFNGSVGRPKAAPIHWFTADTEWLYYLTQIVGWPIRLAVNLPGYIFLGVVWLFWRPRFLAIFLREDR